MERVIGEAIRLSSQWERRVKEGVRLMVGNPILLSQAARIFQKLGKVLGWQLKGKIQIDR